MAGSSRLLATACWWSFRASSMRCAAQSRENPLFEVAPAVVHRDVGFDCHLVPPFLATLKYAVVSLLREAVLYSLFFQAWTLIKAIGLEIVSQVSGDRLLVPFQPHARHIRNMQLAGL